MKKKILHVASGLIFVILAACGPASAPTLSVADIQSTGVALAWTGIAMTHAALPTATPVPPTATLLSTATTFPTLISEIPTLSLPAGSSTPDPCNSPPPYQPKGTQVQVHFINKSGGSVNLSFGMNKPNDLGECGTYSFSFGEFGAPAVKVLAGCYWGYAWISGKKPSTARSTDSMCFTDASQYYEVTIGNEVISVTG